ncbi:MAG: hypothetical protein RPU41_06800, partial [Candidatus Sedimenticola sp. (ex Thyasira tokunagai)]
MIIITTSSYTPRQGQIGDLINFTIPENSIPSGDSLIFVGGELGTYTLTTVVTETPNTSFEFQIPPGVQPGMYGFDVVMLSNSHESYHLTTTGPLTVEGAAPLGPPVLRSVIPMEVQEERLAATTFTVSGDNLDKLRKFYLRRTSGE